MRWLVVVASLWLVMTLILSDAQARNKSLNHDGGAHQGKRKKDGHGNGWVRAGRPRPPRIKLVAGPSFPLEPGENKGKTLLLESYKNLQEHHSSYTVIPGKQQQQCVFQGLTMFDQAVWSPKSCVTCLCTRGQVVCDKITCPKMHCHFPFTPVGECCPICMEPAHIDHDLSLEISGDSPVPIDPAKSMTPLTQDEVQQILWRENKEHREEKERLRKKGEAKKKRRKEKKEQAQRQRKLVEERRAEQEALRLELEKEEGEWRKQMEETERRRQQEEEDSRWKETVEREASEMERKLEEGRRRQEEKLRERLQAVVEDEAEQLEEMEEWQKQVEDHQERVMEEQEEMQDRLEEEWQEGVEDLHDKVKEEQEEVEEHHEKAMEEWEEGVEEERDKVLEKQEVVEEQLEEVWLRGDVFQMPPKEPEESEEIDLSPAPIPKPPAVIEEEDEEEEVVVEERRGLPPCCDISDVTLTCDNAKLTYFPPLSIPELKSLSLEGNNISTIPAEAFNGIPNLEWINLSKNKLTSAGIFPEAFKGLKMLKRLYLDGNLLETLPSDLPPTLQELKISENKLRGIHINSFQDLNNLVILELEGNLLSEGNVHPLAFASLIQLSYLRLGRNYFRTVPQGLPVSLLELYLENNLIEEISETVFNQTQNLNVISLRHNRLDETRIAPMAWINNRNLESIDLSHNQLYLVPSYLPRCLIHLVLVGNNIERIPGFVFAHMNPGLEYLYLSYNKLDGEGIEPESFFGLYNTMVELSLDHNQLITVPSGINQMTNLHFLRLNNNNIRSLPDDSICDPDRSEDATLVVLRMENNYIDPKKVSPTAFSCIHASSSVILKPQKTH